MKHMTQFLKRHSLVCGIVLMFLFTWPIDLANAGIIPIQIPFAVAILVGYGLAAAALVMTGLTLGRKAVMELLRRYLIWRVNWKWYLVALLLFPGMYLLAIGINSLITQTPPDFNSLLAYKIFGASASLPLLILPYFLFDALTNGEEMGWRGYILPRLQFRHSALVSSLIVGAIWWFWHLPKFLSTGGTVLFALYLIEILPKAILYTWLYNSTRGSLLLVTLFHAAGNTAGMFLPVANRYSTGNQGVLIIFIVLEILIALVLTIREGRVRLSSIDQMEVQPDPL
jgi:membrane protease YdiL (CAAX protease family)